MLAGEKIDAAREILKPHLPKNPTDTWDEVIKRLDVSSPENGAVFWSGDPVAAQRFAESIGGVTLETTAGGRIIDGWADLKGYTRDTRYGEAPYSRDFWEGVSEKYAEGVMGEVSAVQAPDKLWYSESFWHTIEKPILQVKLLNEEVSKVSIYTINKSQDFIPLSENYVKSLLDLEGTMPL